MTQKSLPPTGMFRAALASIGLLTLFAGAGAGCLDRPVAPAKPKTTNVFVDPLLQNAVDKIDLLFMIDNSRSMKDKQLILREAVPRLLSRLITPMCIDKTGTLTPQPCGPGTEEEFKAVGDIHIGIVTSSLGGHGADQCSPAIGKEWNNSQDDKAQLLPSVERRDQNDNLITLPQHQNTGFLAWDPQNKYGGEQDDNALVNNFQTQVAAAGETGCGFEASLESWYRFLIDPDPPLEVKRNGDNAEVVRPNPTVLAQRKAFLRPDSLVAIIMLTDENDCSTIDGGIAWLAGQSTHPSGDGSTYHLPRATEACSRNPNDVCCRSCLALEDRPPAGCPALAADPGCTEVSHNDATDNLNLRCWDQKRRYGVDFLYDVDRYISGLTSLTIQDYTGNTVQNPLYSDLSGRNLPPRNRGLVFLAGIIGVPWQDIATEASLSSPNNLEYLSAKELRQEGRWDMILGDPGKRIFPTDALMIESPFDRTTLQGVNPAHPLGLGSLVPTPAQGQRGGNVINGNEYQPPAVDDLQYACIFPLPTSVACTAPGCDCSNDYRGTGKPLCNGNQQDFAKAYPGIRHLQVLKGMGERVPGVDSNAIVASICPKITDREDPTRTNPAYGYNPAVASIIDALRDQLRGKCLPRPLDVDRDTGKVPCVVVEAVPAVNGDCNACEPGRARADLVGEREKLMGPVRERLESMGQCGAKAGRSCEDFCLCEILPVERGPAEDTCLNDASASNAGNQFGYCYVDPERGRGSDKVVEKCPASGRRKIQFIGENTPINGAVALVACLGGTVVDREDAGN
jgi:hypothetical protein